MTKRVLTNIEENRAEVLADSAVQMYSSEIGCVDAGKFEMYSYDVPGSSYWYGFVKECIRRGLSDDETKELLRSKLMRWMFDSHSDKLEKLGASMVTDEMIEWGKSNGQ